MRSPCLRFGIVATAVALSGCGRPGTAPTARASGIVLLHGAPADDVRVIFIPKKGRPAIGDTDEAGRFVLTTFAPEDGAVPGEHRVTISDRKQNWSPESGAAKPEEGRFPKKYQGEGTTPWKVEVKSGENNKFKLEVPD